MTTPTPVPDDVLCDYSTQSPHVTRGPLRDGIRMARRLLYVEARLASMEGKTSFCAECERLTAYIADVEGLLYQAHGDLGADCGVTEMDCECDFCVQYSTAKGGPA